VGITRREGLARVLAGLHESERVGLAPIKVNMVPILGVNEDEIVDFARLTLRQPWEIRFIEYMPVSDNLGFSPEQRFPAQAIMEELSRLDNLLPIPRSGPAGPARLFRYAGAPGRLGVIPAVSSHFCSECNRLRVTADGRVRPCLFSDHEVDLKQALRGANSDQALEEVIAAATGAKPEKHHIGAADFRPGERNMHGIGG
jgi:cyclic pyranopterin phosphate synthase